MARGIPNQADGPDEPSAPPVPAAEASTETPKTAADGEKSLTHAQMAKQESDAALAASAAFILDNAESFSVIFPTGISLFVGDDVKETRVTVGGQDQWIDAVDGHIHLPKGALVRATSLEDLEKLRRLASMRFVESIAREAAQ